MSQQWPHNKHPGSTQSMWNQVVHWLIVPRTCKPCIPSVLIELVTCQVNMTLKLICKYHLYNMGDARYLLSTKLEIEKELNEMVWQGIIAKQMEPTPWVSLLTYPKKPNSKLRICLDPKDLNKALNKAIIRENLKALITGKDCPHIDRNNEVLKSGWKQSAFFGMHLTKQASLLTIFNMHLSMYHFLCVPFGLKMSQDIFQMWMDDIVAQCPGVLRNTWQHIHLR